MSSLLGDVLNNTILTPKQSKQSSCNNQVLLKLNFLSEFFTKSEKRKVLENLGINQQVEWGEIGGFIENQPDLQNIVKNCILKETDKEGAALQIVYTNEEYPTIQTLLDALDKILYKDLTLNVSINPSVAEKGKTVNSAELKWSYNKSHIKSLKIDNDSVDNSIRTLTIEGPITESLTKTVSGNDGTMEISKTVTLNFYPGIYYKANRARPSITSCSGPILQATRRCTITVNAGESEYIWIYLPEAYGTPTFTVGGFSGGFLKILDTTAWGTKFNCWRSDNANLGNTTINIT